MIDSTKRFGNRVDDYVKARPSYPREVLDFLRSRCGLRPGQTVVDIGAGTGISSALFLENGNRVVAVEPNDEMRAACERQLGGRILFRAVSGTAEATGLPSASADMIVAAQAFHWFDATRAAAEWRRILKRGGWAVLIWNDRKLGGTPFLEEYERLLKKFGTDYERVNHRNITEDAKLRVFLGAASFAKFVAPYRQLLNYEGLEGRLRSSSYTPEPGHPNFEPMMAELRHIFERHAKDGVVAIEYDTRVFAGQLEPPAA